MPPSASPRAITATLAAYRVLLHLCPRALRQEYGEEMLRVLKQCCRAAFARHGTRGVVALWLPTLADVVVAAAAEHLSTIVRIWKVSWPMHRLRNAEITVFCAYIAFIVAGMGFQKLTESSDFTALAQHDVLVGAAFTTVVVGSAIALLAALVGGLPLAYAALRHALRTGRRDIPLLFAVPVVAFAVLMAYVVVASTRVAREPVTITSTKGGLGIGLVGVLILGAIASAAAVSLAIARAPMAERLLSFSRVPALIVALAMVGMAVGAAVWGLALRSAAPQLFASNQGLMATSTSENWVKLIIWMGIAALVALYGGLRGVATRPTAAA